MEHVALNGIAAPLDPDRAARFRRAAVFWLLVVNIGWGWSFPAMKWSTAAISAHAPGAGETAVAGAFCGWRFLLAALLYFILTLPQQRGYTRADILGGITTGLTFGLGALFQIVGIRYTQPSVSGFLTSLVVVFVPLMQALFLKQALPGRVWPAVLLALVGLVVLSSTSGGDSAQAAWFPFAGEALTILGSLVFTLEILFLDHYGKTANTARLTTLMFLVTALVNLVPGLFAPGAAHLYGLETLRAMAGDWTIQWTFLSTIVFSSAISFHLMNKYQPRIPASTAGVIYCMEPVCATLFSISLGAEDAQWRLLWGGGLILVALLLISRSGKTQASE